ncbi:hypothetical protein AVEN_126691-1 [Araneus ventricosus]|uniref:Uncharacterized protein n=1 Tax=Araneus ventricosus TaxID=182803 RepID=A0A4Y2ICA8_ARAVE|nr:hypothetical protein AVEN_126691-1 [Araneus ventricosus]
MQYLVVRFPFFFAQWKLQRLHEMPDDPLHSPAALENHPVFPPTTSIEYTFLSYTDYIQGRITHNFPRSLGMESFQMYRWLADHSVSFDSVVFSFFVGTE